jgi:Gas vesicle synthesis protein GvpL/GvpF
MADGDRLERLLDALAGQDAPGLLEEARAAARERVRERLAGALAERLLERVTAEAAGPSPPAAVKPPPAMDRASEEAKRKLPRAPAPAEAPPPATPQAPPASAETRPAASGHGLYVYAVIGGDAGFAPPAGLAGVGGAPVEVVAAGDLAAVVSEVPLDEFGDEALRANLNELPWLEATARAHETVVDAVLAAAPVVPMRLCTIFRDRAAVEDMLARERESLGGALRRLRGSREWGVKVIADPQVAAAAVGEESERVRELRRARDELGEGAGYLASRRLERAATEEADAQLERWTHEAHAALSDVALDSRANPPTSRELTDYEGDMVLNGAYLVPDARAEEFRALVDDLAARHRDHGLRFDLTGPWPAYNFSALAGAP